MAAKEDYAARSKERRRYIRTETSVPMTIYIKQDDAAKAVNANTRNISASGSMLEVGSKLPVGKEVRIEIDAPGSANPVHCRAKIVWAAPIPNTGRYHCGIEFTNIEEDNKNTFLKFLCDVIYKSGGI